MSATSPAHLLTARLLRALDNDYNVIDMRAIDEVISVLENINITKELLEATRLGKHINELRRKTGDAALARRTKLLVKRWRDLVIPDKAGSKTANQPTSAESTPRQSPLANRGISPAVTPSVTPRLSSPQISINSNTTQRQDGVKQFQPPKRQPLTSPALHNLSPGLKNSQPVRNSSPSFKNITSGQKNISPGVRNVSPAIRKLSPGVTVSPALRVRSETIWNITPSKDQYDSDSQDVIFVDDIVEDDKRTVENNSNNLSFKDQLQKCSSKRPRSPINGNSGEPILADELRREAKKARRESGGRKAKKRRNHTKSENRSMDHNADPVSIGSPFLPISSASTSPALSTCSAPRNGLKIPTPPVVSVIVDDLDSRSSTSASDSKSKSSRKNGCKKPSIEVDDYSNFIKSKIPTGGRKVKTTKELLEDMQAKKSGKLPNSQTVEKKRTPKEDFLTTYDSKKLKKETLVVTDIIELNDSNSSSKLDESDIKDEKKTRVKSEAIKTENDSEADGKPAKFEPVDVILSRLPPVDKNWIDKEDYIPDCTCTMVYESSDVEDDLEKESKRTFFEHDDILKNGENSATPGLHNCKESIDPHCPVAKLYNRQSNEVSDLHIKALHNLYIADVNGSKCEMKSQSKPPLACRMSTWGLRPYYDCSRDLFHNVVPKYNYLDYSLDKCVKNLSNITLEKYEPVEATQDSTEWFLNLENEFFEKWRAKNESLVYNDDYESAADSPFSEESDDLEDVSGTNETKPFDSDKNDDSDKVTVNIGEKESKEADDSKNEKSPNDTTDENEDSKTNKAEELCSFFNFTGYGLITKSHFSKATFPQQLLMDGDDNSPKNIEPKSEICVEAKCSDIVQYPKHTQNENTLESNFISYIPKNTRKFTYEDAISLLPLSMSALNASLTYGCNMESSGDLSSVFRTKSVSDDTHHIDDDLSSKETCDLSYSLVQNANIIEMKDISSTIMKRTRDVFLSDHDEDANCDSDVKKLDLADGLTNSGAFESDSAVVEESCVKNGCPSWIPGSVPQNAFQEWHEPVLRTSYNGESLTILPYVVID